MLNTAHRVRSARASWTILLFVLLLAGCSTLSERQPALLVDGKDAEVAAQGSSTVSGTLNLSIGYHPQISKVEYYLGPTNGRPWKVASKQPFEVELDTTELENGEHTLSALVYAGRDVAELGASFVVDNSDDDGAGTNPPPSDSEPGPPSNAPQGEDVAQVLELVNEARSTGYDCDSEGRFGPTSSLELDNRLSAAAQVQADYLTTRPPTYEGLTHTGPDGSSVGDRVSAEGYIWSTVGENIAAGQTTPEEVVQGWLESDGHCRNIMQPAFEEIGLAVAGGNSLRWAQVFAAPR